MRLLIDGRPLQTPAALRGIGRYVGHIARSFSPDPRCRFLFFRGADAPAGVGNKIVSASPRRLITWSDSLYLPPLFRRHSVSCYHSTAYALPRRVSGVRYLLTVYDLTLLKFPRQARRRHRLVFRSIIASAQRADVVMAISAHTAADLGEFAAIAPSRLRIVRPMLDDRVSPLHAEKPRFPLPEEYLFYAGGADPTKNLETLLHVVARLKLPLLVAGGIPAPRIEELVSGLPLPERKFVAFLGYLPDSQLSYLYQHASAFVFPSLSEGFGYPPLEALQCGTPAIVSRAGALPEVLGDAALYVEDPLDAEEWSAKIGSLLGSPGLRRELLARAGGILPRYSPAAFQKSLQDIYFAAE